MAVEFLNAKACIAATERRARTQSAMAWEEYVKAQRAKGGKQIRCKNCLRWRFPDDRCNLFEEIKASAHAD